MPWQTFWTEPQGDVVLRLRRLDLRTERQQERGHFCSAESEPVGRRPARKSAEGFLMLASRRGFGRRHPSWPRACGTCGEGFSAAALWQVDQEEVMVRPGTGEEWERRSLPPGALFDASWAPEDWRGPDGISLGVVLPPQDENARSRTWMADGPARLVLHAWSRTGDPRADPPTVSVTPSILSSRYHGFLTDGILTDSLPDRPLP